MTRPKAFPFAFALVATLALAPASPAEETPAPRAIRVHGRASVQASPDRARLAVSVLARAATAKEATAANAVSSKAVLEKLRAAVRPPGQVRTAGYDLQPQYDYRQDRSGSQGPVLVGYLATNRFSVETADLEGLGALLDTVVAAGAGQVDSVAFFLDDEEAVRAQALLEAGRRARAEAETVARSLGVTLGEVLEASTSSDAVVPMHRMADKAMAMAEAAPATELVPGALSIDAGVSVTFAIR